MKPAVGAAGLCHLRLALCSINDQQVHSTDEQQHVGCSSHSHPLSALPFAVYSVIHCPPPPSTASDILTPTQMTSSMLLLLAPQSAPLQSPILTSVLTSAASVTSTSSHDIPGIDLILPGAIPPPFSRISSTLVASVPIPAFIDNQ
uniref:Uncharacterized protein n=1 Tax=Psilocybe cubensis TaxID=181762 RepID=A0A8H7XTA6_PSICU